MEMKPADFICHRLYYRINVGFGKAYRCAYCLGNELKSLSPSQNSHLLTLIQLMWHKLKADKVMQSLDETLQDF